MNYPQDEKINKIIVKNSDTVKQTMRTIDQAALGIAFIVDENNKFVGLVTDGDIRRAILDGINIEKTPIEQIMNKKPIFVKRKWSEEKLQNFLQSSKVLSTVLEYEVMKIPVLNENEQVIDILYLSKKRYEEVEKPIIRVKYEARGARPVNKVLVIGGAGYLGSILCRKLLEKGYMVRVLDNLMYGDDGIKDLYSHSKFELIKGDMRNLQIVMKCLKRMDAVIHLAAIVGDPASALNPQETIEINYLSTKLIAEVCKYYQINRFIFASTCSVYGVSSTPETRINEESPLNPVSLYAEMKLKSEKGILELMDENFSPTILRMATLYGLSPRTRFDLIVNLLTAKAVIDQKITIFGGEQWRPNLHVKDAAEAYIKCLEAPINKIRGEIFNVGSNDQNYQIKEIGNMINLIITEAEIITDKENVDRRDYNVAFDKIKKVLNYKTKYTIKNGVTDIRDAIKNGSVKDYTDVKYSNYNFLQEKEEKQLVE
jgi:nucleoside-diphosphate-sugar epimerase/CBS domain-containing protein